MILYFLRGIHGRWPASAGVALVPPEEPVFCGFAGTVLELEPDLSPAFPSDFDPGLVVLAPGEGGLTTNTGLGGAVGRTFGGGFGAGGLATVTVAAALAALDNTNIPIAMVVVNADRTLHAMASSPYRSNCHCPLV